MNTRHMRTTTMLAAGAALALTAALMIPSATAQTGGAWEYAELSFTGFDAIINTGEKAWLIEGPDNADPIALQNNRQRSTPPSLQALHLNTLGRSGWEVVPASGGGGSSFLLRRPR